MPDEDGAEKGSRGIDVAEDARGMSQELEDEDIGSAVDQEAIAQAAREPAQEDDGSAHAINEASAVDHAGLSRRKTGDESERDEPEDENEGDIGGSAAGSQVVFTPSKSHTNGLCVNSPPPPPSPTFIDRNTPTRTPSRTPSRAVSPSPPVVTLTPPHTGRRGDSTTAGVEVPHFKSIDRWEALSPTRAEEDDPTEEMVDLPLSAPFESISLSTDEPERRAAGKTNGRPVPLTRGFSQPSVLDPGAASAGDKRSKRASFAYGSQVGADPTGPSVASANGHGRGSAESGVANGSGSGALDFLRRSSSGRKSKQSDVRAEAPEHPPVPPSEGSGSVSQAGQARPRIAAPSAHPHSENPTIAALIAKGLDPKTAPSYLATRDGNESPPPSASEERSRKRKSLGVFGLKRGTSGEKERAPNGDAHAGRISTSNAEGASTAPAVNGHQPPLHRQPSNQGEYSTPLGPVNGPSMLDKVRNQTRQVTLPPKSREEDEGHLRAWEAMMQEAKAAEQHRQERQQQMRDARERKLAESLPVWESILAMYGDNGTRDWREHVNADPKLRRVWFEGCPSHLRGRIWALCIGNGLALSKGSFKACSVRAQKAIKVGRFPPDVLEQIEKSSATVFPFLKLFQPSSPMQEELQDLLCAWYVSRTDEGLGYIPSIALLAAMLLMTMSMPLAFVSLRNLLERDVLKAFYCRHQDESDAYYRIFDNLQADLFPKIYANCKHLGIRLPSSYFTTLFLHQLPFDAACRVWDQILFDGDGYIFRVALAILALLEPRLHFPDKQEIESILEGRNPATLAIVQRERERARHKGLKFEEDIDGVLSVFNVDEQALCDRLAQDQWKESRYERLVQREMPDI